MMLMHKLDAIVRLVLERLRSCWHCVAHSGTNSTSVRVVHAVVDKQLSLSDLAFSLAAVVTNDIFTKVSLSPNPFQPLRPSTFD
jgi:hypothetical protein